MNVLQIDTEARQDLGKKATRALRQSGKIPAVLYSKNGVHHFTTTHNAVKSIVFTPDLNLAELNVDGKSCKALVQKIDFHPVTDQILHMDFLELIDGHHVKADVPLKFKGESPGVKSGGKLIKSIRTVRVKTTPEHLVDELFVDISKLKLGFAVRVKDIEVPDGIELLIDSGIPVGRVVVPRVIALEEEEEEGAEVEEGAEGAEGEGEVAAGEGNQE